MPHYFNQTQFLKIEDNWIFLRFEDKLVFISERQSIIYLQKLRNVMQAAQYSHTDTHESCVTWLYIHTFVVPCKHCAWIMYIETWFLFVQLYTQ